MNYPYNPSYITLQPSPSSSASMIRSSPSPPPSSNSFHNYHSPIPIPVSPPSSSSSSHSNNHHGNYFQQQRQTYPTSSPYNRHQSSPEPSPSSSKTRLPPITSSFTNGYASPAASSYSSEPGSRDEIDESGGNGFHGQQEQQHVNLPGVNGIMLRGDGMQLDKHSPKMDNRAEWDYRRKWNMRDFTLVQTVGMCLTNSMSLMFFRNGNLWKGVFSEVCFTKP